MADAAGRQSVAGRTQARRTGAGARRAAVLLLLDEPAGGLNHEEVADLGTLIRSIRDRLGITVLLVEHHMGLVMGLSDQVVVLNFGRVIADGRRTKSAAIRPLPRPIWERGTDGADPSSCDRSKAFYGQSEVVHGIDVAVEEGGMTVLLGANGAGKTTTLRAICGMVRAEGEILFAGKRVRPARHRSDREAGRRPRAGRARHFHRPYGRREPAARRLYPQRHAAHETCSACTDIFRSLPSGGGSRPAPCPAASSRCSPSPAR